jgi:N6-L-threonylcarbamoyladenine synthase
VNRSRRGGFGGSSSSPRLSAWRARSCDPPEIEARIDFPEAAVQLERPPAPYLIEEAEVEPFLQEEPEIIQEEPEAFLTLGIETSCDETSVAVLRGERELLANVISSQVELHELYGGIVPEIASRAHVEAINPVIAEALRQADITFWDIGAVAVTMGPGLVGSLIVGLSAGKALASVLDVPLIGVNHLEAHLYGVSLAHEKAALPAIGLIVSGGHSIVVRMQDHGIYEILGETLDDAAGEAFDKIARYLGLGFPGGPVIDQLSRDGNREAIAFPRALKEESYDFSFSGLKTAVVNFVKREQAAGREPVVQDLCASFQEAIVDVLVSKAIRAAVEHETPTIFLTGGVAANSRLREALQDAAAEAEISVYVPPSELCTDNAGMVACCGFHRYRRGVRTGLDVSPDPNLPLA